MRYVISYVSTADPNLSKKEAKRLLEDAALFNNREGINGVLLCSETNFFQLIEGEEEKVKDLYSIIEKDSRHQNLIKFIDKPLAKPPYEGYASGFITNQIKFDSSEMKNYLKYVEVLDRVAQKSVRGVIETMVI